MYSYRVMLDVPQELALHAATLLRAEREIRGTRRNTRVLTCTKQALFVLAWFRDPISPVPDSGSACRAQRPTVTSKKASWHCPDRPLTCTGHWRGPRPRHCHT